MRTQTFSIHWQQYR